MNTVQAIHPLTDEQRIEAQQKAREIVVLSVGEQPTREAFQHTQVSHYPAWFTRVIAGLMIVVGLASAMPSLFRLYTAGSTYFLHGIDNAILASIVGVSTFLLAEFLIILSTISARVYFAGKARFIFVIPVCLGLAMALVGNWVIAQPTDLFGWLETLAPPIAVLFLALIGERLVLDAIESRHANERAYSVALQEWQKSTSNPEQSPRWQSAYVNALKQALISANAKGTGATQRRELLATLKREDWIQLVKRELDSEDWFHNHTPEPVEVEVVQPVKNPFGKIHPEADAPEFMPMIESVNGNGYSRNGNGNGNHG